MLSDMLMSIVVVVAVVAVGLRGNSLRREGLDLHLTKEHLVSVVEVIVCLLSHFYEARTMLLIDSSRCKRL